jgi:hypothetical protein
MDWGNGLQLTIPGSDIMSYGKDIMIYLVYTLDYSDYNMIQFFYGDWKSNPSFFVNGSEINKEFIPSDIYGKMSGDLCVSCITLSEDVYNMAVQKGLVIQGHGVRLNQVVLTNPAGIKGTTVSAPTVNGKLFSISGQQITRPRHGIYIQNKKKYVVK